MERERLKDLCTNALFDICQITPILSKEECSRVGEFLGGYLADNGVIFLPCKVGDTVYIVIDRPPDVQKVKVSGFEIKEGGLNIIAANKAIYRGFDYDKDMFLTREAAEAALKERDNNA